MSTATMINTHTPATVDEFWCDPQPFRDHVRRLMTLTGSTWRLVAAHAGVSPRAVRRLLGLTSRPTRRIHRELARALMSTDVDDITGANMIVVDNHETRHHLKALLTLGTTYAELAAHLPDIDLDTLLLPGTYYCTAAHRARVRALYDATIEERRLV